MCLKLSNSGDALKLLVPSDWAKASYVDEIIAHVW